MPASEKPDKYRRLKLATSLSGLAAIAFFIFDAFLVGAPSLSMFILLYLVFYLIPVSLFALRNRPKLKYFGYKVIIYALLVAASFGFHAYDISIAEARAQNLIAAVDHYYQDKGAYPDTLQNLVPAYLPEIPKVRIGPGKFYYVGAPGDPHLMYADYPPFGRTSWSFSDRKWINID